MINKKLTIAQTDEQNQQIYRYKYGNMFCLVTKLRWVEQEHYVQSYYELFLSLL